jgi:Tfp pilus assembly protein PilV
MRDDRSRSGFSLIEALFASAVLVAAIVPAMLAFHTHLATTTRLRQTLEVELSLENLYSETEQALLFSAEAPNGNVNLAGPIRTVVTHPTDTSCGKAKLYRLELSAKNGAICREGLLYGVRMTK